MGDKIQYPAGHGFDDSKDPGYPNGNSTYVWPTHDEPTPPILVPPTPPTPPTPSGK